MHVGDGGKSEQRQQRRPRTPGTQLTATEARHRANDVMVFKVHVGMLPLATPPDSNVEPTAAHAMTSQRRGRTRS